MTITRGSRGLGQLIFLAVLFALVADATAQQPAELIIRNGLIVTADGRTEGDLRIRNGTIAEIGPNLTAAAGARVIEAKGMLVLPGGVDPHVHLTPTRTATTCRDPSQLSPAARRPSATLSTKETILTCERR